MFVRNWGKSLFFVLLVCVVVDEVVGTTTKKNIKKISKASADEFFSNSVYDVLKDKYLSYVGH